MFAIRTVKTGRTFAFISVIGIHAYATVSTSVLLAGHRGILAIWAVISRRTDALVICSISGLGAGTAVGALFPGAVVHRNLALGAVESRRTTASVATLTGVEAGTAILARLVVGAEI